MKRKVLAVLLTVLMLTVMFAGIQSADAATVKLYVNNKQVSATVYTRSKYLMLPVRLIMEELGYDYTYKKNKVTITDGTDTYTFTRGSTRYYDDGSSTKLKVSSQLKYKMIYAPYDFFTDVMGITVQQGSDGNYYVGSGSSASTATATPTATTRSIRINGTLIGDTYYTDGVGTIYVPLQSICSSLGYTFSQSGSLAYIVRNSVTTVVESGSKSYSTGGTVKTLNNAVAVSGTKIYVPTEFVQSVMGGMSSLTSNYVLDIYSTNSGITTGSMNIYLNGTMMAVTGYTASNGVSYVPLKEVAQALGFTYTTSGTSAIISRTGEQVQVTLYSDTIFRVTTSGYTNYNMGYNTDWYNNAVYVPIQFFNGTYVTGVISTTSNNIIYLSTTGSFNTSSTGAVASIQIRGGSGGSGGYVYTRTKYNSSGTYTAVTSELVKALGGDVISNGSELQIVDSKGTIKFTPGYNSYTMIVGSQVVVDAKPASSAAEYVNGVLYFPIEIITSYNWLNHATDYSGSTYYITK